MKYSHIQFPRLPQATAHRLIPVDPANNERSTRLALIALITMPDFDAVQSLRHAMASSDDACLTLQDTLLNLPQNKAIQLYKDLKDDLTETPPRHFEVKLATGWVEWHQLYKPSMYNMFYNKMIQGHWNHEHMIAARALHKYGKGKHSHYSHQDQSRLFLALDDYPDHPKLLLTAAQILRAEKNSEESLTFSKRLVDIRPEWPHAQLLHGLNLRDQQDYPAAITAFETARRLQPNNKGYGAVIMETQKAVEAYEAEQREREQDIIINKTILSNVKANALWEKQENKKLLARYGAARRRKKYGVAKRAIAAYVQREPADHLRRAEYAKTLFKLGKYDTAVVQARLAYTAIRLQREKYSSGVCRNIFAIYYSVLTQVPRPLFGEVEQHIVAELARTPDNQQLIDLNSRFLKNFAQIEFHMEDPENNPRRPRRVRGPAIVYREPVWES